MGYAVNAHAENLVPGESLDGGGSTRYQATYVAGATNGGTDSTVAAGRSNPQGPIGVEGWREVDIDIFLSAFTGTSITFFVDRQGTDGRWYQVAAGTALTAASTTSSNTAAVAGGQSFSIGPGLSGAGGTALGLGKAMRIRWTGTYTVATFTLSVIGKS